MNWVKILEDFHANGVSQQALADLIGCKQCTLSQLKTGRAVDPHYSIGAPLVEQHKALMLKVGRRKTKRGAR